MKIGYLGPKGSFTNSAAKDFFKEADLHSYPTISSCIRAAEKGEVAVSVVPIENTIEGTVNPTLDFLFHKSNLVVEGELVMPIAQQLLGINSEVNLADIQFVYSHPQALAQCQEFLDTYLSHATIRTTDSTSQAAKFVAEQKDPQIVAIGPKSSAEEYNLAILKHDIQDSPHNKTRFWLVGKNSKEILDYQKASLCLTMPNNLPGALHKALTAFSWREINLNKIESRPLKTTLGEYFFLVDVLMTPSRRPLLANAIEEIKLLGGEVRFFGCYPVKMINPL